MMDEHLKDHSYVAGQQSPLQIFYYGSPYWLARNPTQRLNRYRISSVIYYKFKADRPFNVH
jgi:hypothetical protein